MLPLGRLRPGRRQSSEQKEAVLVENKNAIAYRAERFRGDDDHFLDDLRATAVAGWKPMEIGSVEP